MCGFVAEDGSSAVVYNNVWYGQQVEASQYPVSIAGVTFGNNIISGTAYRLYAGSVGADYNVYDCSGSELWSVVYYPGDHSLYADPLFVDPEAGDFTLDTFSPAVDAGDPGAAWNDVDGSRNDIGAFGGPAGTW